MSLYHEKYIDWFCKKYNVKKSKPQNLHSYNVKAVEYDTFTQYTIFPRDIITGTSTQFSNNIKKDSKKEEDNKNNNKKDNKDNNKKDKDNNKIYDLKRSLRRTKDMIYKYAQSNTWEYFITTTFDPEKVNRYDYDDCSKSMTKFLHLLKQQNPDIRYIIVPEQHKDGAFHFHGVIANAPNLKIVDSGCFAFGKHVIKTNTIPKGLKQKAVKIYNFANYRYGFSNISKVKDSKRVSTYITKYITKELCSVTKGKKRYWCTKNLDLPQEYYTSMTDEEKELFVLENKINGNVAFIKEHTVITPIGTLNIKYLIIKKSTYDDDTGGYISA